jgi:molybdate transport system substrate-binding protein
MKRPLSSASALYGYTAFMRARRGLPPLLALLSFAVPAAAEEVVVAVAANFLPPLRAMAEPFAKASGHRLEPRPGSTGELYAQITNGAPYDVLLAADAERPERLEKAGHGVAGTRFTYAIGRLVLFSTDETLVAKDGIATLKEAAFGHLAIADPKTAPYGAAAIQVLDRSSLRSALEAKIVYGQSISQAFQFVTTGNAELGFVALSQLEGPGNRSGGSRWLVPAELHDPIRQDAILLSRAERSVAAKSLLEYLRSDGGRAIVRSFGYEAP